MVNYGMLFQEQTFYKLLGGRIRAARERHTPRLSQIQLAAQLNLSRASVVNIEVGRQHPPLDTLWAIADALDIELRDLIPTRAEYEAYQARGGMDERIVAEIETHAAGNETTRDALTAFITRSKPQK